MTSAEGGITMARPKGSKNHPENSGSPSGAELARLVTKKEAEIAELTEEITRLSAMLKEKKNGLAAARRELFCLQKRREREESREAQERRKADAGRVADAFINSGLTVEDAISLIDKAK